MLRSWQRDWHAIFFFPCSGATMGLSPGPSFWGPMKQR